VQVILERRWFLAAFFLATVALAAAWIFTRTPIYRAEALVLVEPTQLKVLDVQDVYDPTAQAGQSLREYYRTQHELLRSRRILEPVYERFGLAAHPTLAGEEGLEEFRELVSVYPLRDTRLVRVTFEWPDPARGAEVANAIVDSYVVDNQQRSLGISDQGLRELRDRAKQLRLEIEEASDSLERFKKEKQLVALDETQTILTARLTQLNEELGRAQTTRIQTQSELEALHSAEGLVAPLQRSILLDELQLGLARLHQEVVGLRDRLAPNHPQVVAAQAQLAAAQERLETALLLSHTQTLAAAELRYRTALSHQQTLEAEIERQTQSLFDSNESKGEYQLLVQTHQTVTDAYQRVIERIEEIELTSAGEQGTNIFVIERATAPNKPSKPEKLVSLAVASLFGLVGGVVLCFLVDYLDRSVKTREEVEHLLGAPVLGYLPAMPQREGEVQELRSITDFRSPVAEACRSLRTGLVFGMAGHTGARSVLVTSALPGDGKTVVAANLALTLGQTGKRVLLVDADLRRPRLSKVFGVERGRGGLSNFLAEDDCADPNHMLIPVEGVPGLRVLASGPTPPNPADLLESPRMGEFMAWADGEGFDWVVVDSPPMIVADPAILLGTHVSHGLFVVRTYRTPKESLRRAANELTATGGRLVGAVINHADVPQAGGGYGDYAYSYEYRSADRDGAGSGRVRSQPKVEDRSQAP
jgi:polysaccharide biosynthesis transport protein